MAEPGAVPCGIAIPQVFPDGRIDMGLVGRYVRRAEDLGYHSLWVQEQIIGTTACLEPISLLSYVSAVTERIRLGTSVLVTTTRNPVMLAKELSTLDNLSQGRLIMGLALGGRPGHYRLLGAPTERRVRHFVEGLAVMEALWTQPGARFDGEFWTLDGEGMEPKPVQRPRPPLWFGGRHPDALMRAVRHADGWMGAGSTTSAQFTGHVESIWLNLVAADRDPSTFAISKRVYVAVDDDEGRAERRLREWFGLYYGSAELASRVAVWGSPSRCVDGLMEIVRAGADMVMLNSAFDHMEHLEVLTGEVVPHLSTS